MMEFMQLNDGSENRAQVGIGTLIVFIAMVLVAAIAAGVLVNTAGFLQATAEDTGQESVDQVTERLEVINEHATAGSSGDIVGNITLTVGLSSGAGAVDINSTTIKYTSDNSVTTLTNNSTNLATSVREGDNASNVGSANVFNATPVKGTDTDGSFGVLNSEEDRYEIVINANDIEGDVGNEGLERSETVRLEITTQDGGTTEVILTMPDQFAGSDRGEPVPL